MDTASELDTAMMAFSDGRKPDMEDAIQRLFSKEVEIDDLRRATLEELSSTELPNVYREDLKRLVNHLDEFADQIKDSARSLKVLTFATQIPRDILDGYLKMSHDLVDSVKALGDCIEILGTIPAEVKTKAELVDHFEDLIDQQYLETKMLFMKHGGELDAATLLSLRDLLDYVERASDTCARTADYLRTLATSELH
jgi:predicted phosphate transport protein (TIGR00153 family)